jgi:glycosyltransferase involved in cell wall biosynthesis
MEIMHSLILTIHNKDFLLDRVLNGIKKNTIGSYELIVILDGCSDKSKDIVLSNYNKFDKIRIFETPDVFETKANNVGLKNSDGEYCIIIQDDMIINEYGWNERMQKPFQFDDVFAVTSRTAHNWEINPNSVHIGMKENLDTCWCDILNHTDHASRQNIDRNTFAIRSSVNRGPLMIKHADLKELNYLDEAYSPQDMDDHDLCYRAKKQLNKVCGCYWIDVISQDAWGGTRVSGSPAKWLLNAHHKNTKLFYARNKDILKDTTNKIIESRYL